MPTGLIVFARMSSSRCPGKMLMPIAGRPLLGLVLDRTRRVKGGGQIVVATSTEPDDDAIADFAAGEGIDVFRGSLNDVAARALACCQRFGFDRFARICGDRPFMPWEVVEELLEMAHRRDLDLATNVAERSYPVGTVSEVVATEALRRLLAATSDAEDREHLTRYFYTHQEDFRIGNLHSGHGDWAALRLSVDDLADIDRTAWMLAQLGPRPETARLEQIAELALRWHPRQSSHT
jgi:spore coat polysaccharide biosynthesis protein SpsF (cytidylyltransferase family)